MPKLPRISGNVAVKIFLRLGFRVCRQKGSHVVLRKGSVGCVLPLHKELATGTLKSAIRQAGVSVDEFVSAYKNR